MARVINHAIPATDDSCHKERRQCIPSPATLVVTSCGGSKHNFLAHIQYTPTGFAAQDAVNDYSLRPIYYSDHDIRRLPHVMLNTTDSNTISFFDASNSYKSRLCIDSDVFLDPQAWSGICTMLIFIFLGLGYSERRSQSLMKILRMTLVYSVFYFCFSMSFLALWRSGLSSKASSLAFGVFYCMVKRSSIILR